MKFISSILDTSDPETEENKIPETGTETIKQKQEYDFVKAEIKFKDGETTIRQGIFNRLQLGDDYPGCLSVYNYEVGDAVIEEDTAMIVEEHDLIYSTDISEVKEIDVLNRRKLVLEGEIKYEYEIVDGEKKPVSIKSFDRSRELVEGEE